MPVDRVAKLIVLQPRAVQQKQDRMIYAVNAANKLGIKPEAPVFVHALRVIMSIIEWNWKKKIGLMKSAGWTEEEILGAFNRYHDILSLFKGETRAFHGFLCEYFEVGKASYNCETPAT